MKSSLLSYVLQLVCGKVKVGSESLFNFPVDHGFKIYPFKNNIPEMAKDKRIKTFI